MAWRNQRMNVMECCVASRRATARLDTARPDFSTQGSLFSTAALGASLFPELDRYRLFARKIYPLLVKARSQWLSAYSSGARRPAIEPVLLLGVCLHQYLEGEPDRQAVEQLRCHAGWNFALNRQLGDPLFHPTTWSRFRDRLEENQLAAVAFQAIIDGRVEAGLLRRQAHQRLDSTHRLGAVSRMSRVDSVRQALRLALEEIAGTTVAGERPPPWAAWWERYVESRLDYRANAETLNARMKEAGADAWQLLQWLKEQPVLAAGEQAALLAQMFQEQFLVENAAPRARGKGELASDRVQNPHDPDATYGAKQLQGQTHTHVGYKVQVAESVVEEKLEKGEPTRNFLTGVLVQAGHESDEAGAQAMTRAQAALGIEEPPVKYVDGAYVSAQKLVEAAEAGRELVGPAQPPPNANASPEHSRPRTSGSGSRRARRSVRAESPTISAAGWTGRPASAEPSIVSSGTGRRATNVRCEIDAWARSRTTARWWCANTMARSRRDDWSRRRPRSRNGCIIATRSRERRASWCEPTG